MSRNDHALQENIVFNHTILVDGQIVGTWKRTLANDAVTVETNLLTPLSPSEEADVEAAVTHYARFLKRPIALP